MRQNMLLLSIGKITVKDVHCFFKSYYLLVIHVTFLFEEKSSFFIEEMPHVRKLLDYPTTHDKYHAKSIERFRHH